MARITIKPRNPFDFSEAELEDLAVALRELDPANEVQIQSGDEIDPRRRAVTWDQILTIGLPAAVSVIELARYTAQAIQWARRRLREQEIEQRRKHEEELANRQRRGRKPKVHISYRPQTVNILAPDGSVLSTVRVTDPESEPEVRMPEDGSGDSN